jgi:hypothetical protein
MALIKPLYFDTASNIVRTAGATDTLPGASVIFFANVDFGSQYNSDATDTVAIPCTASSSVTAEANVNGVALTNSQEDHYHANHAMRVTCIPANGSVSII